MRKALAHTLLFSAAFLSSPASSAAADAAPSATAFQAATRALFEETCSQCHNATDADGGLDVSQYGSPDTLTKRRAGWESIRDKLRSGEMPPSGVPRHQDQIDRLVRFLDAELERADQNAKPDPGRVTLRRLNRTEYTNTIRDLLSVEFRADESFPADDSGEGFDNIGDVLTVSPVLMEKYLSAAERIAARAIGADPLPKPLEAEYHAKDKKIRRPDVSTIEATHRIEWDAEYVVRIGLPGERAADAKPVNMGFWMDGKLLRTMPVETKPSKLVYFDPFSVEETRLYLPEGDHTFRAGFIGDDFVKGLTGREPYDRKKNKYLDSMTFVGPFASSTPKASRKRILVCDPNAGPA